MDIKRILCPTDFSEASAHAIDQATVLAGWYKARITALHVNNPAYIGEPGLGIEGTVSSASEADLLRAQTSSQFGAATSAGIDVNVLVDTGPPAACILARAAALPANLIVMGTHGTSGFERFFLGSVTEKVLRKATCPVLTVPPRAQTTAKLPFRRLLCAVDFSECSLEALQFAASLAEESEAALTVLHVLEWPWDESAVPTEQELPFEHVSALAEYRRYLETMAMTRLESVLPPTRATRQPAARIRNGKSYVRLLEMAAEEHSDLIVIGMRGRNPIDIAVFGSTANHVVRRATCPVLTLRR